MAARPPRRFLAETRGAAAVELVLWLAVIIVPVLSAVDVGAYAFQRMQLELAAQAAAQAAWAACDSASKLPATKGSATPNCGANLQTAMTNAAQTSSLPEAVTISVVEGYYCATPGGALQVVGSTGSFGSPPTAPSPFDCHTVTVGKTVKPGDYIQVTASYAYAPVFTGLTIGSLLTTPITHTAWMRLG